MAMLLDSDRPNWAGGKKLKLSNDPTYAHNFSMTSPGAGKIYSNGLKYSLRTSTKKAIVYREKIARMARASLVKCLFVAFFANCAYFLGYFLGIYIQGRHEWTSLLIK